MRGEYLTQRNVALNDGQAKSALLLLCFVLNDILSIYVCMLHIFKLRKQVQMRIFLCYNNVIYNNNISCSNHCI